LTNIRLSVAVYRCTYCTFYTFMVHYITATNSLKAYTQIYHHKKASFDEQGGTTIITKFSPRRHLLSLLHQYKIPPFTTKAAPPAPIHPEMPKIPRLTTKITIYSIIILLTIWPTSPSYHRQFHML
jgi:hypothetical protein